MNKCLYCYKPIDKSGYDYHESCSLKLFDNKTSPVLDYDLSDIESLAQESINRSLAVTGVQKKISLDLVNAEGKNKRLTIVGLWGAYILKPPVNEYPEMPELEDLTMNIAELAGISTAIHGLITMRSGELAYITKRFDRKEKMKIAVEDFCQLTENLTENKYTGSSMEKIGRTIKKYSDFTGLDLVKFFNISVFSYLTGNADMHLKNFTFITEPEGRIMFSPFYDLLPTKLFMPADTEEMALTLNGKKKNLTKKDFIEFGQTIGLDMKVINNEFDNFRSKMKDVIEFIDNGFISTETKNKYTDLITERAERISLL